MQTAITLNQLRNMIRRKYEKIPPERVYFAMRKLRVRRIYPETVETMRYCLVLHKLGIYITSYLIADLKRGL